MIFYCHLNLYTIISKTHFIRFSLPAWSGFPFQVPGSIGYPLALGQGGCLVFRGDHRATDCNSGGGDSHCWNLEIYWICSVRIHWPEATPIWPWLGLHRTDLGLHRGCTRLHVETRCSLGKTTSTTWGRWTSLVLGQSLGISPWIPEWKQATI